MAAREKILIVDDDRDLVATLRLVLEKAGYDVAEANEPEAALAAVEERRPDLVLLDIMMPNSTEGFQFIWRLRRRPEEYYHRLPVIMISAAAEQTGLRFYPESGDGTYPAGASVPVQDFLDKPIEPAHLLDKIQKALVAAWRKR